jgi:hypothetical protein
VKRILVSTLAVVLSFVAAARALADDKPVVAVTLPSYNALVKDVAYVAKLVGMEGAEKKIEEAADAFAGGLEGLDKSKPLGFVVNTDGAGFTPLVFLPVTDADKLLKSLGAFVASEDAGDGVKKLTSTMGAGQAAYLKTKGGWAYVAQNAEALATLPEDPLKSLGGLDKDYDVATRLYLQNVPDLWRSLIINGVEQGVKATLRQKPDESEEEFAVRKKLVQAQVDNLVAMINDMDQVTLGWNVDATGKKVYLDIGTTVLADSKTAKKLAEQYKDLKTDFGGFFRDDAVVAMNGVSKITAEDATATAATFSELRKQLMDQLEKSDDFDNEAQKAKVKELANKMMDVLDGMIKGGRFDAGLAVLGDGPFTIAYGMYVPDPAAAEKAVKDVIKLAEEEGLLAKVEYDAEKKGDVRYHRITPNLGGKDEEVSKVLGPEPKIIVGIGKNALYVGVGSVASKTLQLLIEESKAAAGKPALPMQFSVALEPILKFVAKQDPDNEIIKALTESVAGGQDHVRITGRPIPNGQIARIEVEEGVVKLIAASVMTVGRAFGAGAAPAFEDRAAPPATIRGR